MAQIIFAKSARVASEMPYQIRLNSFISVVPGPESAVRLFDDLSAEYPDEISVCDMDGTEINIETLRQALQDDTKT